MNTSYIGLLTLGFAAGFLAWVVGASLRVLFSSLRDPEKPRFLDED